MTSLLIFRRLCRLLKCNDRIKKDNPRCKCICGSRTFLAKTGAFSANGAIHIMQLVTRVNPPEMAISPLARRPLLAGNA